MSLSSQFGFPIMAACGSLLPNASKNQTGCDSTGSFSGIEKKKSFKVLSENIDSLGTLDQLGEKPILVKESDGVRDAIKLVCLLYDPKC